MFYTIRFGYFVSAMTPEIYGKEPWTLRPFIEGLNAPPSSWIPIARDGNMCALVAKDSALCVTNPLGLCQLQDINISNPDVIAYTDMATSFNNKYIALFTQTGMLWIGTTDLQVSCCYTYHIHGVS